MNRNISFLFFVLIIFPTFLHTQITIRNRVNDLGVAAMYEGEGTSESEYPQGSFFVQIPKPNYKVNVPVKNENNRIQTIWVGTKAPVFYHVLSSYKRNRHNTDAANDAAVLQNKTSQNLKIDVSKYSTEDLEKSQFNFTVSLDDNQQLRVSEEIIKPEEQKKAEEGTQEKKKQKEQKKVRFKE